MSRKFTIGRLASSAKVNVETIRYYQRRGLLEEPEKPMRGHRHYPKSALKKLQFIKQAQALGFSLEEIIKLTTFNKNFACSETNKLLTNKVASVEQKLSELTQIHYKLSEFMCQCKGMRCAEHCPIIQNLNKNYDTKSSFYPCRPDGGNNLIKLNKL